MKKNITVALIIVWSVIALVLIGILMACFVISRSHRVDKWNFIFNNNNASYSSYCDKSFAASELKEIDLHASSADVNFDKGSGDNIRVKISGPNSDRDAGLFSVSKDGTSLQITQKSTNFFSFFSFWNSNRRVEITLPESYKNDLNLKLTSGDLTFTGDYSLGNVTVSSTSGDFKADSIKSDSFSLKKTSGDITIGKLDAKYEIGSSSGDISLDSLSGHGTISTISGDLHCSVKSLDGSLNISATSGTSKIDLDSGISADINANTVSGDVDANFPMDYSGRRKNHAAAKVGSSPYNSISVSVVSGDIRFNKQ